MRTLSTAAHARAIESDRPVESETDQMVEDVLTGLAWHLWGKKAPAKLAAEIGCDPRTVERYMEGSRDWSGDAIAEIFMEILKRRKMRNVRVVARK